MLFIVLAHVFIWDLFSEFDYHFSPDELKNLINPKRSFGPLESLKSNDFIHCVPIFHHFDLQKIN